MGLEIWKNWSEILDFSKFPLEGEIGLVTKLVIMWSIVMVHTILFWTKMNKIWIFYILFLPLLLPSGVGHCQLRLSVCLKGAGTESLADLRHITGGGKNIFGGHWGGGKVFFHHPRGGGEWFFLLIIIITIICILSNMREFFQSVVIFLRCARYFIYLLKYFSNISQILKF